MLDNHISEICADIPALALALPSATTDIEAVGCAPAIVNAASMPGDLADAPTSSSAQPVFIYPKASLGLLRLKCPSIRHYCENGATSGLAKPFRLGLNGTLALFDGGEELVHQSCSTLADFDQASFEASMSAARLHDAPRYACAQARADGSTHCPTGGCPLPNGKPAETPTDLLSWDCNIKDVGQNAIAQSVAASEFGNQLIGVRDGLFIPVQGVFEEVKEETLLNRIVPHLGILATLKHAIEIGKLMRVRQLKRMEFIKPDHNFICFANGTLNLQSRQLEAHDPTHRLLNRIAHPYLPEAQCSAFLGFLNDIWAPDADRTQKIQFIRQWMGYLLVADSRMQKMVIFRGEGANGKSVLMDVIREMVGEVNATSAMLSRLRLPYVRATMEGKLLNQSADLPKAAIVADGDMKALVSGDALEVSPKFKPSYTIKPYTRLMVATNNMPSSRDTSEGYFRRLIIVPFNRQFEPHERNPHLLHNLLEEMPGIVAWAVQGLYEVREQGAFSIPPSSEQAVEAYRENLSPVRMFADECLTKSPDRSGYSSRDIFMAFRAWCRDRGFEAGNMVSLGRDLSNLGFHARKSGITYWLVKVKESGQDYFKPAAIVDQSPLPAITQESAATSSVRATA